MKRMTVFLLVLTLLSVSACSMIGGGSQAVAVGDLPAYPGATELKAGDSRIADTLAKNSQQGTALSQAMGAGGKLEQRGFTLPKETTWDAVKKFYDDKLKSSGWSEPSGVASNILAQVNAQNDAFQTATYQRGNQTLAVLRVMIDPTTKDMALIFSLNTR
jgi:hypothetical protein